jgi:hypothetical protein
MALAAMSVLATSVAAAAAETTLAPGTALYTDAVTYCAEPVAIIVESMDIGYHR